MSKVLLGTSGGVDSSVSAWMLQRDGHELVAVTLRLHESPSERERYARAADVCARLGIEHHEVDGRELYDREVLLPFVEAHEHGLSPNPNARAMRAVVYPLLERLAEKHGCDHVALGSYAAVEQGQDAPNMLPHQLVVPLDKHRDETYYFHWLSQEQLARTLFPLWDTPEPNVRLTAMRAGLMLPELEEGLQLRFLGGAERTAWLEREGGLRSVQGDAVHISTQEVVGTHQGLHRHAVGTRFSGGGATDGEELYVVAADTAGNRLLVGPKALAGTEQCMVRDVNWVSIEVPEQKRSCKARFAWGMKPVPVQVVPTAQGVVVTFNERVWGVQSGEPIVFYSDKLVLGGGIVVG